MKWLCTVGVAVSLALQPALADELFGNHPLTPQARDAFVTDLLKKMTVDEKIGQLRLISVGPDNPKEAIREMIKNGQVGAIFNTVTRPDIRVMQDQVMQLSRLKIPLFFAYDVLHGQRTVFPISLGLASSFNLDAVKTVGRVSAYEAADDGLNMTWAPMVDVSRDPRWGRASEGFGEDTYLTTMMGQSMVESMQGKSPADRYSVMTSVKHFAAYGAVEGGKEYNTVDMSPQRLFNDYMPPYKAGLDAGSGAVMVALNSLNGTPATSDSWLLKDVLRDQWGFKGITVSDHGAIKELIKHGVASDPEDAVRVALKSGINMSMSDEYYSKYLPGLVKEDQQADALLETWFAGTEGGHAIADVLFGDYNPSGKLPMSFPRSVGQIPTYYSHLNTGRPYNPEKPNKYTSRYFDEANGPLYPFGYGLSYTTFSVSDVNMSSATMPRDGSVTASVQVTNTGNRKGATVIQLYLQDVTASMSRPVKMLRGFKKVTLKPGETQTVSFPIDVDALKFWNQQMKYVAEPGKFNVFIGVDSARVKQSEFELL
ncbi:beta-glucosidase BglX [Klebsiella pneumoniae]|uniref:beta-glucosidase BglX n=1 Tax=Klebsiella pneumoniae TaxID=573 RepID=UPI000E2A7C04|nr:beta-glucosidase BglX [Klebsiella pneumoniae]SWL42247.1 beta-D-glucoside glucohydrolase [Klebsiella pneumoniae]